MQGTYLLLLSLTSECCKLQPKVDLAHRLFLLIKFYWTTATLIHLGINYGCFHIIKGESNATETIWPVKTKIFTLCSVREKVCQCLLYILLDHRELDLRGTLEMILGARHSMDEDAETHRGLSD